MAHFNLIFFKDFLIIYFFKYLLIVAIKIFNFKCVLRYQRLVIATNDVPSP
jgi:hypothetical protein